VEDGEVVAAVAEERLDRRKMSRTFPTLAVEWVLQESGLDLDDVDEIAVGWNPSIELESVPPGFLSSRRWRTEHLVQVPARLMRMAHGRPAQQLTIEGAYSGAPPLTFVNHYDAHIGASYFMSDWDEAAIVVMDGRGEKHTSLLAAARGADIEPLEDALFPHSLGLFYGAVTQYLGFKPDSDEWKVMALASFGDPDEYLPQFSQLIRAGDDGRIEVGLAAFEYYNYTDPRLFSDRFVELFGPPREPGSEITPRHEAIAASAQAAFEQVATKLLHVLHELTGMTRIALSGGCFMNSVFNGKVTSVTPFQEAFISSCPDDSGTSVGAALYLEALRTGKKTNKPVTHNYWGPKFTDQQCLAATKRYRLPHVEVVSDAPRRAAEDLVEGRIVGWFQDRMEFGQRALGNRSILLDPRRADGKDVVNAAVKYRESFRPFAPAILAERVSDYFDCPPGVQVPFMERVLPFKKDRIDEVPAVVHVDGTGRLQTVDRETNPGFAALIEAFAERTGVPIVLNTSFNLNGEPIVCTPEDAIRTFYTCALEVLYLGNVRVSKTATGSQEGDAPSSQLVSSLEG
jgi:carbamoyltransferase